MKKIIITAIIVAMILPVMAGMLIVSANENVSVTVDGKKWYFLMQSPL